MSLCCQKVKVRDAIWSLNPHLLLDRVGSVLWKVMAKPLIQRSVCGRSWADVAVVRRRIVFGCLHRTVILRNCKNTGKSMWTCTSWTKIILHLSLHLEFDYDFVLIWCWGVPHKVLDWRLLDLMRSGIAQDPRPCAAIGRQCIHTLEPPRAANLLESKIHWTDPIELTPMFFILAFWWLPTGLPW